MDYRVDDTNLPRALWLTSTGWAVGLGVTGLVVWSPLVSFGFRSPSLHLVVDSVDACVALLVAYLLAGRFARRRRLQDLLLAQSLMLLAVAGTGLSWLTEALSEGRDGTLEVWLPQTIRLFGVALIATAALVRPAREAPVKSVWWVVAVPAAAVVATSSALWAVRFQLPVALDGSEGTPAQPTFLAGHPLFQTAQGTGALCLLVASVAFALHARDGGDPLLRWLGPACALAACARVNYVLFPSLYTDWFYTGDLLRTGFYVLLLFGASREITQYWDAYARVAVLDDRRRLARELHDGVIQELALLRMEAHSLTSGLPAKSLILAACDRALDEARAAVHAFGRDVDESLGLALNGTAKELARRYGFDLEIVVDDSIEASMEQQHALLRITREAVANAVHHGGADRLGMRLGRNGGRCQLVVRDNGTGFDPAAATDPGVAGGGGYGLTSMRERARALPGALDITSQPGEGSEVRVTW